MPFSFCAHSEDVEQGPDFQLTKWWCRYKCAVKSQGWKQAREQNIWLRQVGSRASGPEKLWHGLEDHRVTQVGRDLSRLWVQPSLPLRAGAAHLPSAFAFPWFYSITADSGDCLAADAARSLQWCIPDGAAASFPGWWGAALGCGGTRHAGGRIAFSHCLKHFATSMTSNCFAVFSSLNNGDYCFFKILHNLVSLLIQFEYIYVFTRSVLQNIVETLFPSGCPQRSVGGTKRSDKQTWSKRQPFIWMWGWQRACLWISDGELPLQEPVLLLGHVTSQQTATFFWLISWY